MGEQVKRYSIAGAFANPPIPGETEVVFATDHDRVVAEARELLQAASTLFSPVCTDSTQRDWIERIRTWLEKNAKPSRQGEGET